MTLGTGYNIGQLEVATCIMVVEWHTHVTIMCTYTSSAVAAMKPVQNLLVALDMI